MFPSWFPGISTVSISFAMSKNNGTACHSIFDIELIPDFMSPKRISESGFSDFIIDLSSSNVSWIIVIGSTNMSFSARVFSKPICKSETRS